MHFVVASWLSLHSLSVPSSLIPFFKSKSTYCQRTQIVSIVVKLSAGTNFLLFLFVFFFSTVSGEFQCNLFFVVYILSIYPSLSTEPDNWLQRLCISSGGNSKRVTVPRHQTQFEKLSYKFTLNHAISYACCWQLPLLTLPPIVSTVSALSGRWSPC
jgi:hypothetical protein